MHFPKFVAADSFVWDPFDISLSGAAPQLSTMFSPGMQGSSSMRLEFFTCSNDLDLMGLLLWPSRAEHRRELVFGTKATAD